MTNWRRQVLQSCPSTNGWLKSRLLVGKAVPGDVLMAINQTAGLGRLGRRWISPPENIALSAAYPLPLDPALAPLLSIAAGIAVAETIATISGLKTQLKWPNDVLLNNRKVAGILCETVAEKNAAIIGIGVNLNSSAADFPPELRDRITTVRDASGFVSDTEVFITRLLEALRCWLGVVATNSKDIIARAESLLAWRGNSVRITACDGIADDEGELVGLEQNGYLVLRAADGRTLSVRAGIVSLREKTE